MRCTLLACLLLLGCSDDGAGSRPRDAAVAGACVDAACADAPAAARSPGCGAPAGIASGAWQSRAITVGGAARSLQVWLPADYDPARAYPVIYELHGCSGSPQRETNNVPVEREVGSDAIAVRGRAASGCWDTALGGPDVPYFDAMLADVEAAFCVDTTRRFVTGYSSGAFMAHRVGCIRGAQLRGVATIAGGQGGSNCTGDVAALMIHDANDPIVPVSDSEDARASHLARNACTTPPTSAPTAPAPCATYAGCAADRPVVWCETTGKAHDRQDALAAPAFWGFISAQF